VNSFTQHSLQVRLQSSLTNQIVYHPNPASGTLRPMDSVTGVGLANLQHHSLKAQ